MIRARPELHRRCAERANAGVERERVSVGVLPRRLPGLPTEAMPMTSVVKRGGTINCVGAAAGAIQR
jgi:hypothetical protein